ncbi:hypothetical protein SLEP1_g21612 [Rubroshorea leprosula]|uniref:PHD-type domain-containing protein n=1 Tax=Rubroshorea leprosula TaxID=152421 RepID=A0AAV5JFP9_9ROSI|nr:hypothetical protein SLEP1_g21612 [Rubroshorea leprosula]
MKRDLDFALGAESELAGSLVRRQESPIQSQCRSSSLEQVDASGSCKRAKVTLVNGYIVYTRTRKSRINACDRFLENLESRRLKGLDERRNDGFDTVIEERPVVETVIGVEKNLVAGDVVDDRLAVENRVNLIEELSLVEIVIEESQDFAENAIEGDLVVETFKDNSIVETLVLESQLVENAGVIGSGYDSQMVLSKGKTKWMPVQSLADTEPAEENQMLNGGSIEEKDDIPLKALRWFSRSLRKPEAEPQKSLAGALQLVENEVGSNLDEEAAAEGSGLGTTRKNLELKMSKKIALNKCPMTVKELFETGILDGVTVIYMGTISSKTAGLRGIIKDGGILCSCSLCKGRRVIPPSQFEIHACKQYKRAAQYICFENGKSLLEVLRACRRRPLHMLESTIQSIISALPEEKFFSCRRCKGTFPIIDVGQIGPLCNSCVELKKKSQGIPNSTTKRGARSQDAVLVSQSSGSASVGISSQNNCFRPSEPVFISHSSPSTLVDVTSQNKRQRKKPRKYAELDVASKSPKCDSQIKTTSRVKGKPRKSSLLTKSSKSASMSITSQDKVQWKLIKRSPKSALISKSLKSALPDISLLNRSQWKMTTKDQRLHKLVFEDGGLPDGSEVAYFARGKRLLVGYKKGSGIVCQCCNSEVSPSTFEAHAGWASRRKPYAYIYTSNGVSLHELAISLSKGRRYSAKDNDDACIICADGGNLLLCDGCPRAFHKECASLSTIPRGRWYCNYCQNLFLREKFDAYNANALAAGRVVGVDAIDQITRRCIRIVKNIEAELSGCVLCRCSDFSKSGFGPRTIILCDQCEKEYHIGCLRSYKMADLKELPEGKWFCCTDCNRIHTILQKLLDRGAERIPEFLLDVIKKKYEGKGLDTTMDIDVRWRLLSGKIASPETRLLLSQAVSIFHECFNPIVDATTGRDLIPCMVYGRNLKGQEYGGMYCAVLTVNSLVVSAGILRVFGQEIAELPLVATSIPNHGKGYFQLLFSCIEKLLAFLNVKTLVLPAAEEAESIWTNKFGFKKLEPDQFINYRRSCCQMVRFKGTSMLHKEVPVCQIASSSTKPTESGNNGE